MTNESNKNGGLDVLIIIFIAVLLVVAYWYYFRTDIIHFVIALSKPQLEMYQQIPFLISDAEKVKMAAILNQLQKHRPESFDGRALPILFEVTGYGLRLVVTPILILSIIWVKLRNFPERFTRNFNLDSLVKEAAKVNPFILPIIGKNLHRHSLLEGPFRRPLSGIELAGALGLLTYKGKPIPKLNSGMVKAPVKEKRRKWLNREKARYVSLNKEALDAFYTRQLGKPFTSIDSLPPHYQAMLAITCARVAGGKGVSKSSDLLEKIAGSYKDQLSGGGKLNVSLDYCNSQKILSQYWQDEKVQEIAKSHAFEKTLVMAMLEASRSKGKLPPNQFLWLKVVDRDLFLTLNPVGTPYGGGGCAFFESQGAWAHFKVEKQLKRALGRPAIEAATDALEEHLREEEWIDVTPQKPKSTGDNTVVAKFGIGFEPQLGGFDPEKNSA